MKNLAFTLLLIMSVTQIQAQNVKLNRDPQYIVDPTGIMRVLAPPTEVEGSADMFEDWQEADVYLDQGESKAKLEINYDILNNVVAVKFQEKEYSLNPLAVDSMRLINRNQTLVNTRVLKGLQGDAMLLKVYEGPHVALYRKTLVEIIKPNYNELLNVGNRNYQIDQDTFHYLAEKADQKYHEMKGRKKDFKELPQTDQVETFIKKQHLNLKEEADLIEAVKYFEQVAFGEL